MTGMMENGKIYLKIVSPEKTLAETHVASVSLPGKAGRFTVLKDHAPLISSLVKGEISWQDGKDTAGIHIDGGFAEVLGNRVTVCAEITGKE